MLSNLYRLIQLPTGSRFTEDNFCSILGKLKTETRRLLTLNGKSVKEISQIQAFCQDGDGNWIGHYNNPFEDLGSLALFTKKAYPKGSNQGIKSKYNVGDCCYLTEPTRIIDHRINELSVWVKYQWYKADKIHYQITETDKLKIESRKTGIYSKQIARFMLKSFARYWIEITDVQLERLNDISEESAIAEGVKEQNGLYFDYVEQKFNTIDPVCSYFTEIEHLHGKEIAQSNPWVWVYKFKLRDGNFDNN